MNCSEFLERFSDWTDGSASSAEIATMESHLVSCGSCSRYRTVVHRASTLVRTLPEPELREDFAPRLRHRIYALDEERAWTAHQSATPALTVLGMAVLLALLAWAPLLRGGAREVTLEPIVVDGSVRQNGRRAPVLLSPPGSFSSKTPATLDDGLWDNTRFYEYSALSQRYNQRARVRRVSDVER